MPRSKIFREPIIDYDFNELKIQIGHTETVSAITTKMEEKDFVLSGAIPKINSVMSFGTITFEDLSLG